MASGSYRKLDPRLCVDGLRLDDSALLLNYDLRWRIGGLWICSAMNLKVNHGDRAFFTRANFTNSSIPVHLALLIKEVTA